MDVGFQSTLKFANGLLEYGLGYLEGKMVSVEVEVDFVVARGGEEVAVELKGCEVSVDGDYVGKEFGLVGLVLGVDVERTEGLVVDHAVLDLEVGVEAGVGFEVFGLDGALQGALDGDRLRSEE